MKVIVVGCGLIGISTAYFLRRRGHKVTVIDREEGAGRKQLCQRRATDAQHVGSMERSRQLACTPRLARSVRFASATALAQAANIGGLGSHVLEEFQGSCLRAQYTQQSASGDSFAPRDGIFARGNPYRVRSYSPGELENIRDPAALDHASEIAERRSSEGLHFRRLSSGETVELEPVLTPIADQLAGALHTALTRPATLIDFASRSLTTLNSGALTFGLVPKSSRSK